MNEAQKSLLRAYGALQWALGYLEAQEASTGKHADLTFLAESVSDVAECIEKVADKSNRRRFFG